MPLAASRKRPNASSAVRALCEMRALARWTRMRASNSPGTSGLVHAVNAAGLQTRMMCSVSLRPVMKMTGTWARALFCFRRRQVSKPSVPGISASMRMMSGKHPLDDRKRVFAFARDQYGHAGVLDRIGQHAAVSRRVIDDKHDVSAFLLTHGCYELPPAPPRTAAGRTHSRWCACARRNRRIPASSCSISRSFSRILRTWPISPRPISSSRSLPAGSANGPDAIAGTGFDSGSGS